MPTQPLWLKRLPELRSQVSDPEAPPWWDRPAIEKLFGLKRRQAIALLRKLKALRIGTGFAVERATLQRFLEDPKRWHTYKVDALRSTRVTAALDRAHQEFTESAVSFPIRFAPQRMDMAGLPPGITLERQRLTIVFQTPQELLERLFALSQAFAHDYESLEQALGGAA